jgi:cobalt/nickel transport system ATP-binding protein
VSTGSPAFALEAVSFAFEGGPPVLSDLTLSIGRGEAVALLGANGSGKSTFLKLLGGLLFPRAGRILAFGEKLSEIALRDEAASHALRRRVGFVFHNADAQLFSATVRDEIGFGPRHLGLGHEEVERRTLDVAAMLGIDRLLDRAPFRLSAGEKRRVALASVLSINPEVLLLDEPTSGLDPRTQRWLAEMLVTLRRAGKTIVAATHDLELAAEVAGRALVLGEDHRVHADGPVAKVLTDIPLLLSVNLIHAQSHWHGGHLHVHQAPPGGHRHEADGLGEDGQAPDRTGEPDVSGSVEPLAGRE